MPNIEQLKSLRNKYGDSDNLIKGFDVDNLSESFRYDKREGISGFDGQRVANIKSIFEMRHKVTVVTLFIDMVDFSTRFEKLNNDRLSKILDYYYDTIIPIIYKYGGEVEKIIGDGIICVFGKPFLDFEIINLLNISHKCSKEIIIESAKINLHSKIAIHSGEVMYYKPNTEEFKEFTMIGKSLTELFRLESVSISNSINFYSGTLYEQFLTANAQEIPIGTEYLYEWIIKPRRKINLAGVPYTSMRYNLYNR